MFELRVRAPNSQFYVKDPAADDVAALARGAGVGATSSSITIGTLQESDGETKVRVYARGEDLPQHPDEALMFDGEIETTSLRLTVESVLREVYFEMKVLSPRTRVTVWMNHPIEPDEIDIRIDALSN